MEISGLEIRDYDGLHLDDDWCAPTVRMRVESTCHASEVRVGVWLPPSEDDLVGILFTITAQGRRRPVIRGLPHGAGGEISVPVVLTPGEDFAFEIGCENRVVNKGEDRRQLSFLMTSLVAL